MMPEPDDHWSNLSIGGNRLTWQEAAESYRERAVSAERLVTVLLDLDRCQHGRHEGDDCFGCAGRSRGNPLVGPSRHVGYTLSGQPIVLPGPGSKREAAAWTALDAEEGAK